MKRSPLSRTSRLEPGASPARRTPLARNAKMLAVSANRVRENRQRRAMAKRRFPDMQPPCYVPECLRPADDLHEILTRARGGSITDEENTVPVCRQHNEELTLEPAWGYELGFLVHSWDATGGAA